MSDIPADSQTPPATVTDTPQYSYDDLHKETTTEIAENKEVPEAVKSTEEIKEIPEEEVIDPQKLVEDIVNQVTERLKPKETPAEVKPSEVKTEPQKDYEEFVKKTQEEKGRVPTYQEALEFVKVKTIEEMDKRQAEKEKLAKEEVDKQKARDKELVKRFNETIDEQLDDLYKNKKLTSIKNKDNPDDQGVAERKALFQAMYEVNQQRIAEGKSPIYSIKEIYYEHYKKPKVQPAGADAPVSMGQGSAPAGEEEQELDYNEIHKAPWSLFRKKN